ncbi:sensor histidine kinase [Paenibacillus ginsengarvi]|uniref:histidine kinase n=1 Tax=Paenibacillus ginsengarvi TaxID=400777 RepID=A0A3B0CHU5_9BACL|nr:HAMP domain-containing sensor histidine kinase [Paenibacillus ginsengarvi]RKN84772.1 HAMP domain-containing protein [Paenibacillus ginsengarvi]
MIGRFRKISTKLFVLTSLLLIFFLTLLVLVQSSFFESYYRSKKINELKLALDTFRSTYYKSQDDLSRLPEQFPEFEKRYSATMAIGQMKDGSLMLGSQPRVAMVRVVDKDGNAIQREQQIFRSPLPDNSLTAAVTAMNGWKENASLVRRVINLGETVTFASGSGGVSSGTSTIAAVAPLKSGDVTDNVLLAVASLQPVGEAAGIFRDFYVYFLLLAIVLIVLLTYVFSRMISRPLVKLNEAAGRMAALDFSAKCDDGSRDEIGSLGGTLNFLSQNLNETLGQLHAANEQLKADIENEKRLERLRREFVASVSHELKTPISLIGGYAEGLKDGIVQGEAREEYLDVIVQETERMGNIVSDMLDLSQLEAGKFSLRKEPFRIGTLAESLTDNMFALLNKKKIVCAVELEDANALVFGDEFRIGQVFTNLLGNAIRHTPEYGKIRISAVEGPGSGVPGAVGTIEIQLFNEGEPIPDADLPHIWDTFYTVDKSGSREFGGSGIGLAIVRNILTLHGSAYGVRNAASGVVFHFTLPLVDES